MTYLTPGERAARVAKLLALRESIDAEVARLEGKPARPQIVRKKVPRTRKNTATCGTDSGYYRHRRSFKEDPCDECRFAHNAAERKRWAKARGRTDAAMVEAA